MAHFKDLCIEAFDQTASLGFWSAVLGLAADPRPAGEPQPLRGEEPQQTVWINAVPEPRTQKSRVHLDVHCAAINDLTRAGATVENTDHGWTVLTDPDGLVLCGFVRDQPPAYRLYELVVDSTDPACVALWWADRLGLEAGHDDDHPWWWVEGDGLPFASIVFAPVPEPKRVKNRVHWDVTGTVEEFVASGARVLADPRPGHEWHVLADPEGNEFCFFGED